MAEVEHIPGGRGSIPGGNHESRNGSAEPAPRRRAARTKTYADQNERDYRALEEAAESGAVTAQTGF
jgi:hypothetical protein